MKNVLLTSILCILCMLTIAQVPEGFNYQAVLRNSSGELISDQSVDVEISIRDVQSDGAILYTETHTKTTNTYGLVNLVIGSETPDLGIFADINWAVNDKFIQIKVDATDLGTFQLLTVPFAMHATSAANLGSENVHAGTDTLFVVKDADGNPVFVVFPDGAKVIVEESAKGTVGGFAVSGRSPTKAEETEIFLATPDSTRIFVNDTIQSKGSVGGFAVSGRSPTKGINSEYLLVTTDSTRIYINDTSQNKGSVGGFAVSGRSPTKSGTYKFLDLTSENYFIGHEAGKSNEDGLYNSFIGYKSGYSNTLGNQNTFIGYYSGYANDEGYSNIFIGDSAGYYNESGNHNIFMGNQAGTMNTVGYQNVFIGNESGYRNENGRFNVFIGQKTGTMNTTGNSNVFVGSSSGHYNTSGQRNVFVGNWCGNYNTVGGDNVFIGNRTGWYNTTGNTNIFIGSYCGFQNTTGSDNIFIGNNAGNESDTCYANIFIGNNSGEKNSSGLANVYLGNRAGNENTSGNNNTILGHESGHYNTSGTRNVLVGAYAGYGVNGGYSNVMLGFNAGNSAVGNSNVFIGHEAGFSETGSSKLFIENSSADSSEALIWGDFSQNKLRVNSMLGVNIEPTGNTIEAYYGAGSGSIMVKGTGNAYSYSKLVLMSDEVVDQRWEIYHNKSNNFELVCNDGVTWYNGLLELDKNGTLTTGGAILPSTDNSYSLGSSSYHWVDIFATNDVIQTSDLRFKTNITDIKYGLNEILKLRPVNYNWKNKPDKASRIGLIAQDVQPIIKEAVNVGDDEDKTLGIKYAALVPVLIKGMQDQQAIIEDQKAKILEMEKRLSEIEKLLLNK